MINKITSLARFENNDKFKVLSYLLKTALKLKPSQDEYDDYFLYMHLISSNGYVIKDNVDFYVINFKNFGNNIIKLRKFPSSDILVYNQIMDIKNMSL